MNTITDFKRVIDEIKARASIVEVAAQYSEVKRRGRLYVCRCLCGENSDRNPSFTLYDQDNHFHCYACGRHGSVIDLVMLVEGLDFKAAVECLRQRYVLGRPSGELSRPRRTRLKPSSAAEPAMSDHVRMLMKAATDYYQSALRRTPNARRYLSDRGLSDSTVAQLRIGYAGGGLGRALFAQGFDLALAAQIGLITPRGEKLRGRIVFPVLDTTHTPVWMIGRALSDEVMPKYDGLPDGLVQKRPMVLGWPKHGAIVVEGAFDFAAAVQWGAHKSWLVVALLGTAHEPVVDKLVKAVGGRPVVVMLDQDKSGKEAALKLALALRERAVPAQVVMDADRQQRVIAYVAAKSSLADRLDVEACRPAVPTNGGTKEAKLEVATRELQLVHTLLEQDFAAWVRWHDAKDLGDLLGQGEQGRVRFEHALVSACLRLKAP